MITACRSCLKHFNPVWVKEVAGEFSIVEKDAVGAATATFRSAGPCILIVADRQAPIIWALAQRKCADGAFLTFDELGAHLHIVEIKSRVTVSKWASIQHQMEGMYLSSVAVARLLSVQALGSVTCYLAGKEDAVTGARDVSASPTLLKTPVGKAKTFGGLEDWDKSEVQLPYGTKARLVRNWRGAGQVADFGAV